MEIYIDGSFRCHTQPAADRQPVTVPFFRGKCREFTEGYYYIPQGREWEHRGIRYRGEMITPGEDYRLLSALQKQYEGLAEAYGKGVDSL